MDRKVSVQVARKPEQYPAEGAEGAEGQPRRRNSTRGRGRGGRGRGTRAGRGGRGGKGENGEGTDGPSDSQVLPLTASTNEAVTTENGAEDALTTDDAGKNAQRPRKQRGPPEDGVPSKTKIMVANLPYDLREEKVRLP